MGEILNWSHMIPFLAQDVIYTSRAYATMSVSVCLVRLSVTEVHWRIIANLCFKFRSHFTAHCGRPAACVRIISRHASQCWALLFNIYSASTNKHIIWRSYGRPTWLTLPGFCAALYIKLSVIIINDVHEKLKRLADSVERRVDTCRGAESLNDGEEVVRRPGHDECQQDCAQHSESFPVLSLLVGLWILMTWRTTVEERRRGAGTTSGGQRRL